MSESKPALTKEELSQRLERLSFTPHEPQISPEHWAYRERAAVWVDYGLDDLRPDSPEPTPAEQEAIRRVFAESTVVYQPDQRPTWRLLHDVRRATLRRLAEQGRLQELLLAHPASVPSMLQHMLEAYIRNSAPPLEQQSLEQLEATLQVVDWLMESLPGLPAQDQIRQRIAHKRLLKPFHFLVGSHFRGRAQELHELRRYVDVRKGGAALAEDPPLLIYGPGGVGKSTLIARLILERSEGDDQQLPYVFIDFNRRDIDIQNPISLLLEAARQLAIQHPSDQERWHELYRHWHALSEELGSAAESLQTSSDRRDALASARQRAWRTCVRGFKDALSSTLGLDQPLLIVLDTLEELLYHNLADLDTLWECLDELKRAIPNLRLVLSGRSPLPEQYPTRLLQLSELDELDAAALLIERGIPDQETADQIIEISGRSPLSLWLAAELYRREHGNSQVFVDLAARQEYFYQIKEQLIQGLLYRRILGHLHDRRVLALAVPGLMLRRITPELILKVLAQPSELDVKDQDDARELFGRLRSEVSVFDINQADPDELRQRPELRLALIELMRQDDPERVRALHHRAAAFFRTRLEQQPAAHIRDRADAVYHRLALEEDPAFLEHEPPEQLQAIVDELGSTIQDLPATAQVFLMSRARVAIRLDQRIQDSADLRSWEHLTARSAQRLLSRRHYEAALRLVETRAERTVGSPLYVPHVQALLGLRRNAQARALIEEGIRRSEPYSDVLAQLLQHAAALDEQEAHYEHAVEQYQRALRIAERRGDAPGRLRIQLSILRLSRSLPTQDAPTLLREHTRLLEAWDAADDRDLLKTPVLIREVAIQVGIEAPGLLARAVRLVGLGASRPASLHTLASALAAWDDARSAALDAPAGELARRVKAGWRGDLYRTWQALLDETPWERAAGLLLELVEQHPLTPTVSTALLDLIKAGQLLTSQQAELLGALLLDTFSADDLDTLMREQFGQSLAAISQAEVIEDRVADLLSWLEAHGQMLLFLQALQSARPNQPQLDELLQTLGITPVPTGVPSDPEQALAHYQHALAEAERHGDPAGRAAALAGLGRAYTERSAGDRQANQAQALDCYHQALAALPPDAPLALQGQISTSLGALLQAQGELNQAEAAYQQALAVAEQLYGPQHPQVALVWGRLGGVLYARGDLQRARSAFETALAISEAAPDTDPAQRADALNNLASVLQDQGEVRRAIAFYEHALALSQQIGDRAGQGRVLGNLGNAYMALGDVSHVKETFEQALAIARETGDRSTESAALNSLGTISRRTGDTAAAVMYLEQALAIARDIGDMRSESRALSNLGLIYAGMGNNQRAIGFYEQSLSIMRSIGDQLGISSTLGNLGLSYASLGQHEQAISFYSSSLSLAQRMGDRHTESSMLGNLGQAYARLGAYQRAIAYYQEGLAIAEQIDDRQGQATMLLNLGQAHASGGQPQLALGCYLQALSVLGTFDDQQLKKSAYQNLGEASFQLKQFERALTYHQQALKLATELGDLNGQANAHFFIGLSYLETRRPSQAISDVGAAREIYQRIGDPLAERADTFLQQAIEQARRQQHMIINTSGGDYAGRDLHQTVRDINIQNASARDVQIFADPQTTENRLTDLTSAVCRVDMASSTGAPSFCTGFLVGPDLLLTAYHAVRELLEGGLTPAQLSFRFDLLATDAQEIVAPGQAYALATGPEAQQRFGAERPWLVAADADLDYALLRLAHPAGQDVPRGLRAGRPRGWLRLAEQAHLASGAPLGVIFFRNGLQLTATHANQALIGLNDARQRLRHRLETAPGASGAPILDIQQRPLVVGIQRGRLRDNTGAEQREGVWVPAVVADLKHKQLWPLAPPSPA